jgi:hypothetical protein
MPRADFLGCRLHRHRCPAPVRFDLQSDRETFNIRRLRNNIRIMRHRHWTTSFRTCADRGCAGNLLRTDIGKNLCHRLHRHEQPIRAIRNIEEAVASAERASVFVDGVHDNGNGGDVPAVLQRSFRAPMSRSSPTPPPLNCLLLANRPSNVAGSLSYLGRCNCCTNSGGNSPISIAYSKACNNPRSSFRQESRHRRRQPAS